VSLNDRPNTVSWRLVETQTKERPLSVVVEKAHDRIPKQVYEAQQREKTWVMIYLAIDPDEWINRPL